MDYCLNFFLKVLPAESRKWLGRTFSLVTNSEDVPRKHQVNTHPGFVLCLLPYPLHYFVNFLTGCVRPRLVAELSFNLGLDGTCPEDSHYNLLIAGWNDSMSGIFFKMFRPRLSYHSFRSQPCHLSLPTDFSKVKSGQPPGHQPSVISTIPLTLHLLNVSSINDMFSLFTRQLCSSSESSSWDSSRCPWHVTALIHYSHCREANFLILLGALKTFCLTSDTKESSLPKQWQYYQPHEILKHQIQQQIRSGPVFNQKATCLFPKLSKDIPFSARWPFGWCEVSLGSLAQGDLSLRF